MDDRIFEVDPADEPYIRAAVDNAPPLTADAQRLIAGAFRSLLEQPVEAEAPERAA